MDNCRIQFHWSIMQCVLLLSLSLAVLTDGNLELYCPPNCQCINVEKTFVVINCQGSPNVNREQLSQQLDSLLSSYLTHSHLLSLGIINTPLTHVPRSVCRLTTLTHLCLDNNQLIQLPDDCFPHLKHLTILSATQNEIAKLQNGLFRGLHKLVSLNFSENFIFEIGLAVFSNQSDMTSLRHIDLSYNNLTSIEPWPLVRGQLGTEKATVVIRLDHNRISTFTNDMRWKTNYCIAPGGLLELDLTWNRIRHVMDFANGWNFTFIEFLCFFNFHQHDVLFHATSFACDCIDFQIYKINSYIFSGSHCSSENSHLKHERITAVPLDQFVCELSERCPLGCRCVYRPANATLHVYCSNTNLTVLPLELPALPKRNAKYYLDFSDNKLLRRLEHRDYFIKTSVLDVGNCSINEIPQNLWNDISTMKKVCLNGNPYFNSMPPGVIAIPRPRSLLESLPVYPICLDRSQLVYPYEHCPPGCWCVYRPVTLTLHVYCSNTNLSVLPLELPTLPNDDTKYYLNFSNNQRLHRLERRTYFTNTSVLDVSNCGINEVPLNVWKDMSEVEKVCIYGNPLKSLPANVIDIQLSVKKLSLSLHNVCLHSNQWLYSAEGCPPGCRCVYRPKNATFDIECSSTNLSVLPLELPALPNDDTKYYLNFSNNRLLRRLEQRDYFINTSVLDISNCSINEMPMNVWKDISTVKKVLLNGNSLKSLPPGVLSVSPPSRLSLERNPWACLCDNSWMSKWLHLVNQSVINMDGLLCCSPARLRGKNIINISNEEFCLDPVTAASEDRTSSAVTISLSSVVGVAVILMSVVIIVYRLRVKLYSTWKFHPFYRDECVEEDMNYDVFISCSSDDNLPHGNDIRERLEQCGYRVCYPPRDFVAGELIFVNIENAVMRSKRTVCLLTSHFLQR